MKRYLIKVELVGKDKKFPSCLETTCGFANECANHKSADIVRIEEGLTPDIEIEANDFTCSKQPHNHFGAIFADGSKPYLERWLQSDDVQVVESPK